MKLSKTDRKAIIQLFKKHQKNNVALCPFNGRQVQIILQPDERIFRNVVLDASDINLVGWTTKGGNYVVKSTLGLTGSPTSTPERVLPVLPVGLEHHTLLYGAKGIDYLTAYGGVWELWGPTKATVDIDAFKPRSHSLTFSQAGLKFNNPFADKGPEHFALIVEFAVKGSPGAYENMKAVDRIVAPNAPSSDSETESLFGYFQRKVSSIPRFKGLAASHMHSRVKLSESGGIKALNMFLYPFFQRKIRR